MHFVDWSRHQDTVKVKDQDVAGIGVKSEGGIRSQLVARVWEGSAGQSVLMGTVNLCP